MNTPLLDQMKTRLNAVKGQWPAVCAQAGVDYVWLFKVMQGRIKDPGVARVERVLAALDQRHQSDHLRRATDQQAA